MGEPTIRLDRSKPFSTCHGDRTPDDPHVKVHYWQGGKFGANIVLLPFDVNGELVPDDGRVGEYQGTGFDPKTGNATLVKYHPLYDDLRRKYLKAKLDRLTAQARKPENAEPEIEEEDEGPHNAEDDVNFESWLRGEIRYAPHLLRAATKKRFHLVQNDISEIVRELVLEQKLIPEDQVCGNFKRFLNQPAAA
jgi:hypothetical protein